MEELSIAQLGNVFNLGPGPMSWVSLRFWSTAKGRSCLMQNVKKDANSNVKVFTFANNLSYVVLGNSTVD